MQLSLAQIAVILLPEQRRTHHVDMFGNSGIGMPADEVFAYVLTKRAAHKFKSETLHCGSHADFAAWSNLRPISEAKASRVCQPEADALTASLSSSCAEGCARCHIECIQESESCGHIEVF